MSSIIKIWRTLHEGTNKAWPNTKAMNFGKIEKFRGGEQNNRNLSKVPVWYYKNLTEVRWKYQ